MTAFDAIGLALEAVLIFAIAVHALAVLISVCVDAFRGPKR